MSERAHRQGLAGLAGLELGPGLGLGLGLRAAVALTAIALTAFALASCAQPPAVPETPHLGRPLSPAEATRGDRNVFADGTGLPPGRGTAVEGAALFQQKCASCHGPAGRGATAEELAGATQPLTSNAPDKTIGSYWPYATTIFDFTRRAMPLDAPASLSDDEVYALTAYLLYANGVIGEHEPMDAQSLPRVRMPNRDGFIGIDVKPPTPSRSPS